MTLLCIDNSQSSTHKGHFLQGGKSQPVSNNINQQQQNANHHRRNSCSPPLTKNNANNNNNELNNKSPTKPGSNSTGTPSNNNTSRYKTELCRPYEENGTCKYGDKCQFAHGAKELRTMARHPKYKTELCRTFHSTGLCPYGPRCHFIHNSEQTRKTLLTHLTGSSPSPTPRSQPLGSLGSAGDLSPSSSHGGTPTAMKSFDELFSGGPLSPGYCDFGTLEYPDAFSAPPLDNYSFQGGPGPVLDLFQTTPLTPTSPSLEGGFFRLPIFDLFHGQ